MDDWVCIFAGNRLAASGLAEALERANLHAFVRHDGDFRADVHLQPHLSRVLVPPEERDRAERIATHWQTHHAERVSGLTGRLLRVLALSLIGPAAWWAFALSAPEDVPRPSGQATGIAWLVSFVAVAQLESRRHRSERIDLGLPPP